MARIQYKEVAGLEAKSGKPAIGEKPTKGDLKKLYAKESKSIREVAEVLECSKDMVYRLLKEYGIERRPYNKRSKLRNFDKSFLKREVRNKGITKVANELSVDVRTLRKYI